MIDPLDVGLYVLGVVLLAVTYLPFSPATVDLVLYSRQKQIAIFERRWLFRGVGILSLLVLFVSALLDGQFRWIGLLGARDTPFHGLTTAVDDRLPAMSYVLGIERDGERVAIPRAALDERPVINETVGGTAIAVLYDSEREIGNVFHRRVGERVLTFRPAPDGPDEAIARDDETGTYWTLSSEAVAGEFAGTTLDRHPHWDDLFWFSWAAFRPDTRVFTSEATSSA